MLFLIVFSFVLSNLTCLLIFFPVFISVFIEHIHQASFRKFDVITAMIERSDIFPVFHFITLCTYWKEMSAQFWL